MRDRSELRRGLASQKAPRGAPNSAIAEESDATPAHNSMRKSEAREASFSLLLLGATGGANASLLMCSRVSGAGVEGWVTEVVSSCELAGRDSTRGATTVVWGPVSTARSRASVFARRVIESEEGWL